MKPWEDVDQPAQARAKALLAEADGPKAWKRYGAWLDASGDVALKQALVDHGNAAGAELPDDAIDWPGKKLIRRSRGLQDEAQKRTTPIARDEAFVCISCGKPVPRRGRTARDHCPYCLKSRHVDDVPGDRANPCGGRMDPYEVIVRDQGVVIRYACTRCHAEKQVRAVLDGDVPDDWEALCRLSAGLLG
jgi:DNA-directed RNA polymerase subunit RPC12/RpoP